MNRLFNRLNRINKQQLFKQHKRYNHNNNDFENNISNHWPLYFFGGFYITKILYGE